MIEGIEKLGAHLQSIAMRFGAERIEHLHGRCFVAHRGNDCIRLLADEGIGSVEGEEGFEQEWHSELFSGR